LGDRLANLSDRIQYLVNAAGTFAPKPFLEHQVEDYDKYMTLNRSLYFVTQAAVRNMKKNGGGSIVNVGSMWAHQAIKATPSSAYSMAKAGLHALTQHLAMELAEANIRVNAIAPAVVNTPVYEGFIPKEQVSCTRRLRRLSPNRPDWAGRRSGRCALCSNSRRARSRLPAPGITNSRSSPGDGRRGWHVCRRDGRPD
jgi:NAD(P)-dependent dehydrogenase (short-subunit alcohol dehydrogenase family)